MSNHSTTHMVPCSFVNLKLLLLLQGFTLSPLIESFMLNHITTYWNAIHEYVIIILIIQLSLKRTKRKMKSKRGRYNSYFLTREPGLDYFYWNKTCSLLMSRSNLLRCRSEQIEWTFPWRYFTCWLVAVLQNYVQDQQSTCMTVHTPFH